MMIEKKIVPRALSLEDIIKQQEIAKYGQAVTVFASPKQPKDTSTLIAA